MSEAFDWIKPSILWQADGQDLLQPDFFRPKLLGFDSDDFVERFLKISAARNPASFTDAIAAPETPGAPLKLFQPVHGRFYLVCGSLCCRLPGLPDRQLRHDENETAFFVLRRLLGESEYAWITSDSTLGWQAVKEDQPRTLMDGEDRLPLMSVPTAAGRSLFFGYLPVASRETYAAPPSEVTVQGQAADPRIQELGSRVGTPLTLPTALDTVTDADQLLLLSVYLLLELWEFLDRNLNDVAVALEKAPATVFSGEKAVEKNALMTFLKTEMLKDDQISLATALGKVAQNRVALNEPGGADAAKLATLDFNSDYYLKEKLDKPASEQIFDTQKLQNLVAAALTTAASVELPKIDTQSDTRYVLRCVYERPQCDPVVRVVSQASVPFTLAPFFDPDAPARTVRIPLPTDVSLAGMRKFKKNVSFLLSDAMRKKMESIVGSEKKLITNGASLNPETGDFAFICSFSIQIIFTIAFFLLLMFVVILNIVFSWLIFFKICLPIPKKLLPE
jgi:hypothetical protein